MTGAVVAAAATALVLLAGLRRRPPAQIAVQDIPATSTPIPSHLVSLYDNRWDQVRYLNELDQKSVILVVTALTGAVVSADRTMTIGLIASATMTVSPLAYFAALSVIVSGGAIYTTVHNRLSMERAMTAIDCLEVEFNRIGPGMFPYSRGYKAPTTIRSFILRTMFSIRGPVIIFFMAVAALSAALVGHAIAPLLTVKVSPVEIRWMGIVVAFLSAGLAFVRAGRAACREFGAA